MLLTAINSQHFGPKLPNSDSNRDLPASPHLSSHLLKLSHRLIEEEGDLLVGPRHGSAVAKGDNVYKNEFATLRFFLTLAKFFPLIALVRGKARYLVAFPHTLESLYSYWIMRKFLCILC